MNTRCWVVIVGIIVLVCLFFLANSVAAEINDCDEKVVSRVRLDAGHPWRPPFGLDRVGQVLTAIVEVESPQRPYREYWLTAYAGGKEIDRQIFRLSGSQVPGGTSYTGRATFSGTPEELVLFAKCKFQGEPVELARKAIQLPAFEAEAIARPERVVNPVDLGTILVPTDWLLLADGQKGIIDLAAMSRTVDISGASVAAWFESAPGDKVSGEIKLEKGFRAQISLPLPAPPAIQRNTPGMARRSG